MVHVPPVTRRSRPEQLRDALLDARRRGDTEAAALLAAWLDDEYVGRAHRRALDPEVARYRRLTRGVA
ncbi:MAG: hypothetical protein JWO60_3422 [Frankiales bacterium]|nr:hypothetical protein [Frankiales bacterium]